MTKNIPTFSFEKRCWRWSSWIALYLPHLVFTLNPFDKKKSTSCVVQRLGKVRHPVVEGRDLGSDRKQGEAAFYAATLHRNTDEQTEEENEVMHEEVELQGSESYSKLQR